MATVKQKIELIDWRGKDEYPTDVIDVSFAGRVIVLTYRSGKVVSVSLDHFPFLANASLEDLSVIELGYLGIGFPRIKQDLHTKSLYDL